MVIVQKVIFYRSSSVTRKQLILFFRAAGSKAYVHPNLGACLEAVMRVYGKSESERKRSRRGERNEARAIAIDRVPRPKG